MTHNILRIDGTIVHVLSDSEFDKLKSETLPCDIRRITREEDLIPEAFYIVESNACTDIGICKILHHVSTDPGITVLQRTSKFLKTAKYNLSGADIFKDRRIFGPLYIPYGLYMPTGL